MFSKRNHSILPFFNNDSTSPRQFFMRKILLKKYRGKMLIKQIIIEFQFRGLGPLAVHVLL